jgi:type II secretory pathway pseudopilin PulG
MGNTDFPRVVAQSGYSYLILLLMVLVMGLSVSVASEVWHTTLQRAREKQLLFVGNQYRQAIKRYYDESPGVKSYPHKLEELLKDDRFPGIKRHLRQLYADPMTDSQDWGLAIDPVNGTIQGVYSLYPAAPMKTARFTKENLDFEGKVKYSDWRFIYVPEQENAAPPPQEAVPPQEGE